MHDLTVFCVFQEALITLQELEKQYPKFKIRVFLNSYNNVFHPKVSHFTDTNGNSTFVVGSGNLTPGGLSNNFEAFSTIIGNENEFIPVRSMWDDFVERHEDIIVPIDDNVIEIAKHNFVSRKEKEKDIKTIQIETDQRRKIIGKKYPSIKQRVRARKKISEPILIARIPKAGGRWRQVHYNRDVIDSFFNIKPNSSQRAFLTEYSLDGTIGDEEIRPLVFSQSNRNLKIEISGRQGEHYPTGNFPPIIVLKKVGVRTFHYTVLMPKDTPYRKIYDYTETIPSIGKGLKRVVVDSNTLSSIWPNCPLCVKAVDPKNWTTC